MGLGIYLLAVFEIILASGFIFACGWALENVEFSENEKTQRRCEIAVKILRGVAIACLAYTSFELAVIILSPLFEQMNAAFKVAVTKLFDLLDSLIPWVVMGGGGYLLWREKHPKTPTTANSVPIDEAAIALARQRGVELQKVMLAFLFRIICATRNAVNTIPPDDAKGIAISAASGKSFYMDGDVVIYQAEVQVNGEITLELEEKTQDELQAAVPKYISEYPALIDPISKEKGYPPVEILTVQKSGSRVIIDAVITTEKSLQIIMDRRQARAERKLKQNPITPPDITIFR